MNDEQNREAEGKRDNQQRNEEEDLLAPFHCRNDLSNSRDSIQLLWASGVNCLSPGGRSLFVHCRKHRDVPALWERNSNRIQPAFLIKVLIQFLAKPSGLTPYDGVELRIIGRRSTVNGHANGSFLNFIESPIKSGLGHVAEEARNFYG